jgi:hypothetical protein
MKKLMLSILIVCLAVMGTWSPVRAQMATMDEALTVARNWIRVIIQKKGDWGGYETAEVFEIQEFKRGERFVGYFCRVNPKGYIVVSLRRELAPVKAYSAVNDLDPESEEGMADLLKGSMERILNRINQVMRLEKAGGPERVTDILEIDYRDAWGELEGDVETPKGEPKSDEGSPDERLESGGMEMNYQEGDVLLSSNWYQSDPFNQQVPAPPGGDDCTAAHCAVGCVALAGAQIMRYWNWPPYGVGSPYNDTYDWPNMPYTLTGTSPAAQINAVAELCHEVGIAVNMDYCWGTGDSACGSAAYTSDMEGVYEDHYRYWAGCELKNRDDYTAVGWFDMMKNEFNYNCPVQYNIPGHSIVGDGWQEIGSTPIRQYHMNYGWFGVADDTWYTLDALLGGDPNEEFLLRYIIPYPYVASSGTYIRESFPYRYFYRDLSLSSTTTFDGGQNLQFLPNVVLTYTGSSDSIRFEGSSSYYSRLFTRGDLSRGVRIDLNANAVIEMSQNGSIKFH